MQEEGVRSLLLTKFLTESCITGMIACQDIVEASLGGREMLPSF